MNGCPRTTGARALLRLCAQQGLTVATAESCTGGLIAKRLTDLAGSSAVFCGGLVTYTNELKMRLLGVSEEILRLESEVSPACAMAMADGARARTGADLAVSTTGFAGPGGGNDRDRVGTVYIAVSSRERTVCERFLAPVGSTRAEVRRLAAARAIALLCEAAQSSERQADR